MAGPQDGWDLFKADFDKAPDESIIAARIYKPADFFQPEHAERMFTKKRMLGAPKPEMVQGTVVTAKLNIRARPSTAGSVYFQYDHGAVLTFYKDQIISAEGYIWRRLADGAWKDYYAAEKKVDGSSVFLSFP